MNVAHHQTLVTLLAHLHYKLFFVQEHTHIFYMKINNNLLYSFVSLLFFVDDVCVCGYELKYVRTQNKMVLVLKNMPQKTEMKM